MTASLAALVGSAQDQLVGEPIEANYLVTFTWWHLAAFVVATVLVYAAARRGWWPVLLIAVAVVVVRPAVAAILDAPLGSVFHSDAGLYYGGDWTTLLLRLSLAGSAAAVLAIAWFVGRRRRPSGTPTEPSTPDAQVAPDLY